MTFKHTKFDSPTLRALEKVAVEKGLVKPEPLQKKAEVTKKADYTPTPNFMENIFKLCSGLRTIGLHKEANEIEANYLNYKRAQTLYETSKEKGEDLVDAAHPKGSHKLEGVDGEEATVESIIDQQLKDLKVVEKKPTGKLSNAASILKAVKLALGQAMPPIPDDVQSMTEDQLDPFRRFGAMAQLKAMIPELTKARSIIQNKMNTTTLAGSFDSDYNNIVNKVNSLSPENLTVAEVDRIISSLDSMLTSLKLFSWKDLAAITGVGALPTALRHVGDVYDIATGNFDSALRDQLIGIVTACKNNRAVVARNNLRGNNDNTIKSRLQQMKVDQDQKKQTEDAQKKEQEGTTPEMTQFATRSKALLGNLKGQQSVMAGPGFTDGDRANINPKIQAKLDQVQGLVNQWAKWTTDKNVDAMRNAAPGYLSQIANVEGWSQRLSKWMNS